MKGTQDVIENLNVLLLILVLTLYGLFVEISNFKWYVTLSSNVSNDKTTIVKYLNL